MKTNIAKLSIICGMALLPISVMANSPYISKVYDFLPAPGQFVNVLPEYEEGDTKDDMIKKVEAEICGDAEGMISLGGYGGYVVFGFDHSVVNVAGEYDFKIAGNSFEGSSEPGIVMVSRDANGNGVADDEWYELAGSEYNSDKTIKKYEIAYCKPDENKTPEQDPNYSFVSDCTYIKWESNQADAKTGYVKKITFHKQSYYPNWITDESISFSGTKLADNGHDTSGNGTNSVLDSYDWGYVDNKPNDTDAGFNIEWAVDADGNKVNLESVDFIKVYTAVNQFNGWIGECSTEITGAQDLHPDATGVQGVSAQSKQFTLLGNKVTTMLIVSSDIDGIAHIYAMNGQEVAAPIISEGVNNINISALGAGIYIIKKGDTTAKFIKR